MVGVCCCVGVSVSVRLCVSPSLNLRLRWFLELNHLIQNFSFKDEITPWRIFTKGKKEKKKKAQKFFSSSLYASLHRERGFSVWKIIIFVGFICGTWELGNELNLTDAVSASENYPWLLSYDHMCALMNVCVCVYLKQYITVAKLLRFSKSTLFDAELDTLRLSVKTLAGTRQSLKQS